MPAMECLLRSSSLSQVKEAGFEEPALWTLYRQRGTLEDWRPQDKEEYQRILIYSEILSRVRPTSFLDHSELRLSSGLSSFIHSTTFAELYARHCSIWQWKKSQKQKGKSGESYVKNYYKEGLNRQEGKGVTRLGFFTLRKISFFLLP